VRFTGGFGVKMTTYKLDSWSKWQSAVAEGQIRGVDVNPSVL
jgi:hypothetical protein